jgi:two-component system chemotaxis response regulator CheY
MKGVVVMPMGLHTKDSAGKGRVMVVDDEDNVRKVIRMTLTKGGYDVVEAEDGGKAVEVLRSDDNPLMVDVITCDIRMPKVNGVEAIQFFREQFPSIPVIVITGFPDTSLAVSLLKTGVVDYVTKPVEGEKLLAVVAKAMEERTRLKG